MKMHSAHTDSTFLSLNAKPTARGNRVNMCWSSWLQLLELGCVSKPCGVILNGSTGKEGHGAASVKAGVAESSRKCWVHVKTDSLLGGGVGR